MKFCTTWRGSQCDQGGHVSALDPDSDDIPLLRTVNEFTLANSFWFTVGTLMQQGSDLNPKVNVSSQSPAANYLNKWCASKLTMFGNSLDICRNSVNIYVYREKIIKYILQILWFLHENNLMIISKINEWKYSEWLIVKIRINEYIIYFSFLSHWFASYINIINKFNHILNKILQKFWMIHL